MKIILLGLIATQISIISCFALETSKPIPTLNPKFAKEVAHCATPNAKSHIWIMEQWHLVPQVQTKGKQNVYPQTENQTAIYRQLEEWTTHNAINTVLAEGCSGKIDSAFTKEYNGWSYTELKSAVAKPHYDEITTHVPLKLKAKYPDKITALCADDDELIKAQALAFSDSRGATGFYTRILQYKDDPKHLKGYLDGVIELYKMPKDTTAAQALARLKADIKDIFKRVKLGIEKRNEKMAEIIQATIKGAPSAQIAFVVGGAHAVGLKKALEKAGVGCTIAEPTGYSNDSEKTLADLEKLVSSL